MELRKAMGRLRQVPKWAIRIVLLWIIADIITYAGVFINWVSPSMANTKINPWLSPWYTNPMYASWWAKFLADRISAFVILYTIGRIALRVSDFLFFISILFIGYRIFDILMFFWNFCRSELVYLDAFWSVILLCWSAVKGYKPSTVAKIKNLF